jgi:methylated-DNA-protein-cysteine methyltransferase-like protein
MKSGSSPRHRTVLAILAAIPRGCVASYGEIAARAGVVRGARWVGHVLRDADPALGLPWHRVLRADGRIAFPCGTRPYREQCRRLRAEGVVVVDGRVDLARFGWPCDLDRALWDYGLGRGPRRRNQPAMLSRSRSAGSTSCSISALRNNTRVPASGRTSRGS